MFKALLLTSILSIVAAEGPRFTLHPATKETHCVDVAPLPGSNLSYTTL